MEWGRSHVTSGGMGHLPTHHAYTVDAVFSFCSLADWAPSGLHSLLFVVQLLFLLKSLRLFPGPVVLQSLFAALQPPFAVLQSVPYALLTSLRDVPRAFVLQSLFAAPFAEDPSAFAEDPSAFAALAFAVLHPLTFVVRQSLLFAVQALVVFQSVLFAVRLSSFLARYIDDSQVLL